MESRQYDYNSRPRGWRASHTRDRLVNIFLLGLGGGITGYIFFLFLNR